jgi:hypothetical protein
MLDHVEVVPDLSDTPAEPDAAAPSAEAPIAAGPVDRVWLGITLFVVAVCNWAFSGDRIIFHLIPDEPGSLAMGRWLSGRNRWNMFDHSTWQPGLGILVTPIYWVTDQSEWVVRWALIVNALLMGVAAAVTVVLTRRLTDLSTRAAAGLAIVVAVTPSALSGAAFVWAEPLVALTFVTTVLCAIRTFDGDGARWAHGAVVAAAAGYLAHARLLPLVATTLATVLVILLWQRRIRLAGSTLAVGLVAFALVRLISVTIHTNVWDEPGRVNTSGSIIRRVDQVDVILDTFVGQFWYLLVATLGVGAIGIVVVLGTLFVGDRPGVADRRSAIVITALTAPQIAVSATFLAGRDRADQLVYGRYNDAVMWPVLIVGLAWLVCRVRSGWDRRALVDLACTLITMGTFSTIVAIRHGDRLAEDIGLRAMVPGLLAFVARRDGVPVIAISGVALIAVTLACFTTVALRRRSTRTAVATAAIAAVGALSIGAIRTYDAEARLLNGWQRVEAVEAVDELVPPDAVLGVKMVPDRDEPSLSWERQRHRYQLFQLFLPHRSFERDRGLDDDVGPYVFAPTGDPELVAAEATAIWNDPTSSMTLYREPDGAAP